MFGLSNDGSTISIGRMLRKLEDLQKICPPKFLTFLVLLKAITAKMANHGQKKSRSNFFGLPHVLNHESYGCR